MHIVTRMRTRNSLCVCVYVARKQLFLISLPAVNSFNLISWGLSARVWKCHICTFWTFWSRNIRSALQGHLICLKLSAELFCFEKITDAFVVDANGLTLGKTTCSKCIYRNFTVAFRLLMCSGLMECVWIWCGTYMINWTFLKSGTSHLTT